MYSRITPRVLAFVAMIGCLTLLAVAAEKHDGKVVEAKNGKLTMTDMDGSNQHSHTMATNAKITRDGKTAKLDELKKGDLVTVTMGEQSGKAVATELVARSSKDKTTIDIRTDSIRIKKDKDGIEITKNKETAETPDRKESARASKLIGTAVLNESEESLGKIEEIVLNPHEGTVNYAVLSFGGFLGMGDKWFAVPWKSLSLRYDNDAKDRFHFVLNVSKERLKNAPGFDKDHFPDVANPNWATEFEDYYRASAK